MPNMYPKPFNVPLEFGAPGKESIDEQTRGLLLDERTPRIVFNPNFAESQGLPAEGEATFSKTPQDFVQSISSDKEVWTSDGVFPSEFEHNRILAGGTPEDQQVVENPKEPKIDWWKGVKLYVQQAGEQIVNTLKTPGEAYKGNLSSEEITQGGIDIAMLVGGLSTPIPKPGLGLFGGRIPVAKIETAERLEKQGVVPGTIRFITGLERGMDTRWRMEIDDSKASFSPKNFRQIPMDDTPTSAYPGEKAAALSKVLNHEEFFKQYPEAKDINVFLLDKRSVAEGHAEARAYFDPEHEAIIFIKDNIKNSEEMYSTLMHELQHWIQNKEGFAMDVIEQLSPTQLDKAKGVHAREIVKEVDAAFMEEAAKRGVKIGPVIETILKDKDAYESLSPKLKGLVDKYIKQIPKSAEHRTYASLSSEVEARNVQSRLKMSKEDRDYYAAYSTEDIPREKQIVRNPETGQVGFGQFPKKPTTLEETYKQMENDLATLLGK